jgi:hypothetical protein
LFDIFLVSGSARVAVWPTRCLTTHECLRSGNPWQQKPKGGTINF